MNTLRAFVLLLFSLPAVAAVAAGPQRNLLVELRWVESSLSAAALAGVREGATVVGTAGSVSPRPGATLSTQRRATQEQAIQRLLVLNGQSASVSLSEQVPLQWLDYAVQLPSGQPTNLAQARVLAAPRTTMVEQTRAFFVTALWPGGTQPVRVTLRATAPQGSVDQAGQPGQAEVLSTVQLPLGDWLTVARSGASVQRPQPGVLSSRDAEGQTSRELQLRVSLAP